MKNWFNISCLATIILGIIGIGLAISNGNEWMWQWNTIMWVFIAYSVNKQSDKNQNNDGKY